MSSVNITKKYAASILLLGLWVIWVFWVANISNNLIDEKDLVRSTVEVRKVECIKGRTFTNIEIYSKNKNQDKKNKIVFNISHFTSCDDFLLNNPNPNIAEFTNYRNATISLSLDDKIIISKEHGLNSFNDKTSEILYSLLILGIFTALKKIKGKK